MNERKEEIMKRKKKLMGIFFCLFMIAMYLGSGARAQKTEVRVDCGPPGGGKNFRNSSLTEAVRRGNPGWVVSSISGPSLHVILGMISRGELEVTTTRAAQIIEVEKGLLGGKPLGTGPVHLRWICVSNYALVTFYVLESVPVNSVDELLEKRYPIKASIGTRGSDPYIQAEEVLNAYGVTFKDLRSWGARLHLQPSGRSVKMLRDGIIEGKFHVGTVPEPAWDDVSRTRPLKLFTLRSEKIIKALEQRGYERKVVPAGSYNFTPKDVPTLGAANLVVIRADVGDEVAYNVARSIWENREFLHTMHPVFKRNLNKETISPIYRRFKDLAHPGAVRYWKEQGIIP